MADIGKNIRRYRQAANMTQDGLAEKLNVTRQSISSWECGKTQPDVDTLEKISSVLCIPIEELIYGKPGGFIPGAKTAKSGVGAGFTIGACLAMILSYAKFGSIGWAILHGILNWFYVIYYVIKY